MQRLVLRAVALSVAVLGVRGAAAQQFSRSADTGSAAVSSRPAESLPSPTPEVSTRLSAADIIARMLEKNQERLDALSHYESDRTYRVEYHGTGGEHHAEIRVHAEYVGPNEKHLTITEQTGPKFLCDKVLKKLVEGEQEASSKSNRTQMTLSPENYTFELTGEERVATPNGEERAWVLAVSPKVANKFSYRGKVWISESDFAVMRIVGEPAKSPSWWIDRASIDSRYVRRGDVWLPEHNLSTSHVRIGGQATLTIDYGTYPVVVAAPLHSTQVQIASAQK